MLTSPLSRNISPLQRTRQCTACKKILPSLDFYRRGNNKSYRSRCRKCYQIASTHTKDYFKEKSRKAATYIKNRYDPKYRIHYARACAKLRKHEWAITLEQYSALLLMGCHYCGSDLTHSTGGSLDRKNNARGYTMDNVLPCCGECNVIRSCHLTVDEMEVVAKALHSYRRFKCSQLTA